MNESSGVVAVVNMVGNTITTMQQRIEQLEAENERLRAELERALSRPTPDRDASSFAGEGGN